MMDLGESEHQGVPGTAAEENSQNIEEKNEETQQKSWHGKKHVKKFHYESIAKQIEFYFSPSNLAKDGFMAKLVKEDPFVPISIFMTFNKIKNFLTGRNGPEGIIRKALSRSTILELSEDQTKVRRREDAPLKSPEEIDESTLYIEQIPMNSTHDSITSIFSRFGKVNYVSLPKYKKSRQIKQFGFVEFDDKESIMKAINCFKRVEGVLQHASIKAENLLSITTFEKDVNEAEEKAVVEHESEEPPVKKARVEVVDEAEVKVEEKVEDVKEEEPEEDQVCPQESDTETKDLVDADESMKEEEEEEEDKDESITEEGQVKKKKNRHHKKKSGQKAFFDERIMAIKIMRKKEWKKMRNAYLTLERQKAKEIKKILRDSYNKRHNNKIQECQKFSPANTASPRINFYGSPNDREDLVDVPYQQGEVSSSSGLTFVPGVIVNIKFREPCFEPKELKKEFKQFPYCNYVDIIEGGAQCYIRVDAPSSAQELLNQYSSCEYETEILKDEAEKEYWKKISEKRDSTKSKESPKKEQPVKRRRGREKLLEKINKASQHIRFDDADDIVE